MLHRPNRPKKEDDDRYEHELPQKKKNEDYESEEEEESKDEECENEQEKKLAHRKQRKSGKSADHTYSDGNPVKHRRHKYPEDDNCNPVRASENCRSCCEKHSSDGQGTPGGPPSKPTQSSFLS